MDKNEELSENSEQSDSTFSSEDLFDFEGNITRFEQMCDPDVDVDDNPDMTFDDTRLSLDSPPASGSPLTSLDSPPSSSNSQAPSNDSPYESILNMVCDYPAAVPDSVMKYYAAKVGLDPKTVDPRFLRFVAVAAQKFIADIALDAMELNRLQHKYKHASEPGENPERTLTCDVLETVLKEYGIEPARPRIPK